MKKSLRDKCTVCGSQYVEMHHWKSKKSGGSDDDFNLMPLCRAHHQEFHAIGAATFSNKYIKVHNWLLSYGWEYNDFINKWRRNENKN